MLVNFPSPISFKMNYNEISNYASQVNQKLGNLKNYFYIKRNYSQNLMSDFLTNISIGLQYKYMIQVIIKVNIKVIGCRPIFCQ